jgi:hypothetical protein
MKKGQVTFLINTGILPLTACHSRRHWDRRLRHFEDAVTPKALIFLQRRLTTLLEIDVNVGNRIQMQRIGVSHFLQNLSRLFLRVLNVRWAAKKASIASKDKILAFNINRNAIATKAYEVRNSNHQNMIPSTRCFESRP